MPSRPRNRKPLVIQQSRDPQHHLDIFLAIKPVPTRALHRLEHWKLRLPIPQNKGLQISQPADLADAIKILLNGGLRNGGSARHREFLSAGDAAIVAVSPHFPRGAQARCVSFRRLLRVSTPDSFLVLVLAGAL